MRPDPDTQPLFEFGNDPITPALKVGKERPSRSTGQLNYGEWGELYVLLRLCATGTLDLADENERAISGFHLNILEVIRHESDYRAVRYCRMGSGPGASIQVVINDERVAIIPAAEFAAKASELLLFVAERRRAPFSVPDDLAHFLDRAGVRHYKARSRDKSDIYLCVEDPRSGLVRDSVGYSIKTKWGKVSTLFNTARASAAKYVLDGMSSELAEEINQIRDATGHVSVTERCVRMAGTGVEMEFVGFEQAKRAGCAAFEENLDLLDPRLIHVFDAILRARFLDGKFSGRTTMESIGSWLAAINPCGVTRPEVKYPYMLKQFLYSAYCGLTASTLWDGASNVNGGLLTVSEKGELMALNALDGDVFKSYLYRHCFVDYPDTSPAHGDYGYVFQRDGKWMFKLNFQVRYK